MWRLSPLLLCFSIDAAISTVDYLQHPVKSCHIGDVVENECNKCLCTSKTVFECTPLNCNRNKNHEEFEATRQLCYPNQLYVQNLITCICTKDGRWPHKSCHDTFQSLPPSKVIKHKCVPDTYVPIDCNICRCGTDGEINSDRCTRNACEDEIKRRANQGLNSLYSNCEVKSWYSLAPCQFCFCVNKNKLVCNTGNYYSKKLELGSYKLQVCGKDLIRDAIELIPNRQKVLRLGLLSNVSKTTKQTEETTTEPTTQMFAISHKDLKDEIKVNRENSKKKNTVVQTKSKRQKLLELTTVTTVPTTTNEAQEEPVLSTKFPFEEDDEMLNESDIETEEDNESNSKEFDFDLEQDPVEIVPKTTTDFHDSLDKVKKLLEGIKSTESYHYVGNTLTINLPKVLDTVFKTALRKSMVSLTSKTKCVKGTTSMSNCNMCFCLKNGKLLCTNNKCTKGAKKGAKKPKK